jgi:hypothetical protein
MTLSTSGYKSLSPPNVVATSHQDTQFASSVFVNLKRLLKFCRLAPGHHFVGLLWRKAWTFCS